MPRSPLFLCLLLAACAIDSGERKLVETEPDRTAMVEVRSLAADLRLDYQAQASGIIQLTRRPDNVILVHENRNAYVNGTRIEMERPCMRRGSGYILAGADAQLVRRTLASKRARREAEKRPVVVEKRSRPSGLPHSWRPPRRSRNWQAIVIHHMASGAGNAAVIHRIHRSKGWDGIGYHFVIGNGTLTEDGSVELGYRWKTQEVAAHCKAPRKGDPNWWNRNSIGICLIGHFNETEPTRKQMDTLVRLIRSLMAEYDIPAHEVRPHSGLRKTDCPGKLFPWNEMMRRIR